MFHFLDVSEWRTPELIHFHSPEWSEISCGGRCGSCGSVDTRELRNLVRPFLCLYSSPPHCGSASSSPCASIRCHCSNPIDSSWPWNGKSRLGRAGAGEPGPRAFRTGSTSRGWRSRATPWKIIVRPAISKQTRSWRSIFSEACPWSAPSKDTAVPWSAPPRTPWRAPPPRAGRVEPYGEDRRLQLERELYALLHEDDGTPYCWNIDEEILTWIADSVRLWSNRDRTLWLCDPDLPAEVQQSMGYPGWHPNPKPHPEHDDHWRKVDETAELDQVRLL